LIIVLLLGGDREWTVELGFRFFFPAGWDKYDMMTMGR
jgi:hypothetical protein